MSDEFFDDKFCNFVFIYVEVCKNNFDLRYVLGNIFAFTFPLEC